MDVDVSVRVPVIHVLAAIDGYSLLEEEEREKLCLLVFDEEPRVRKAVSGFVRGIWEEAVEERSAGKKGWTARDKEKVGIKALAALLVQWGKTLDKMVGDDSDSEVLDMNEGAEADDAEGRTQMRRQQRQRKELVALTRDAVGRTALVVEALWAEVDPVREWEDLLNFLLLDHSAAANGIDEDDLPERPGASVKRGNGRREDGESAENGESENSAVVVIDEAWRLEEVEEGILLEVLVAAIRRAKADAVGGKKVRICVFSSTSINIGTGRGRDGGQ